jgi:hypothetical protein
VLQLCGWNFIFVISQWGCQEQRRFSFLAVNVCVHTGRPHLNNPINPALWACHTAVRLRHKLSFVRAINRREATLWKCGLFRRWIYCTHYFHSSFHSSCFFISSLLSRVLLSFHERIQCRPDHIFSIHVCHMHINVILSFTCNYMSQVW